MEAERARALLDEFERMKVISAREGARYRVFLLAPEGADPLELAESADRAIAAASCVAAQQQGDSPHGRFLIIRSEVQTVCLICVTSPQSSVITAPIDHGAPLSVIIAAPPTKALIRESVVALVNLS